MLNESIIRLTAFLGIFVGVAAWEYLSPRRPLTTSKPVRWFSNISITVLGTILVRSFFPVLAASLAADQVSLGILNLLPIPYPVKVFIAVLAWNSTATCTNVAPAGECRKIAGLSGNAFASERAADHVNSQKKADDSQSLEIGIDEKLGQYVPLDLYFKGEAGKREKLGDAITMPTIVALVFLSCRTTPKIAWLFDSVPPLVKITSAGLQFRMPATCLRAVSTAFFGLMPYQWELEGLPNSVSRKGRMASITSGSWGVVPL